MTGRGFAVTVQDAAGKEIARVSLRLKITRESMDAPLGPVGTGLFPAGDELLVDPQSNGGNGEPSPHS